MILQLDPKMRESIEAIKAELGKGCVVYRERQTGKTTALMEYIHGCAPLSADIIVVVCNLNEAYCFAHLYRELYPRDGQPCVRSIQTVKSCDVAGTDRCWVTDEVWPHAVVDRVSSYEWHTYLGGVGTSMCMNLHS